MYLSFLLITGSPKKVVQRRAVSMPGLERETEMLEASKRNSSQTNCTVASGFPPTSLNIEGVPNSDVGNLNTSVIATQEVNKGNI